MDKKNVNKWLNFSAVESCKVLEFNHVTKIITMIIRLLMLDVVHRSKLVILLVSFAI